ncbi:hypothetical protein LXL04_007497 [Taraxacum kok-saghyz]
MVERGAVACLDVETVDAIATKTRTEDGGRKIQRRKSKGEKTLRFTGADPVAGGAFWISFIDASIAVSLMVKKIVLTASLPVYKSDPYEGEFLIMKQWNVLKGSTWEENHFPTPFISGKLITKMTQSSKIKLFVVRFVEIKPFITKHGGHIARSILLSFPSKLRVCSVPGFLPSNPTKVTRLYMITNYYVLTKHIHRIEVLNCANLPNRGNRYERLGLADFGLELGNI